MSSRRVSIALALTSLVVSLVVAEAVTRKLLPRPGFATISEQASILPHPSRGYAYAPNTPGFTNSLGLRDDPIAPGETVDVLAVGDSFTVGGGVRMEQAWPAQLESLINSQSLTAHPVRVVNAGVAAYSLRQIRVLTEELTRELDPKMIVLGLFSSRYWRINDPYVAFHGSAIRTSETESLKVVDGGMIQTPFKPGWLRSVDFFFAEHFYIGAHVLRQAHDLTEKASSYFETAPVEASPDVEKRLKPLLAELDKIREIALTTKRPLVVMLINEQQQDGSFKPIERKYNEVVKSFCSTHGIKVVDPLPVFEEKSRRGLKLTLPNDHHWSKLGHEVAAKELLKYLTRKLVSDTEFR